MLNTKKQNALDYLQIKIVPLQSNCSDYKRRINSINKLNKSK